jgi:hypothetical protein
MIQKSKQTILAFRVSQKLKKQVENKCKSEGVNISNYLGNLFNEILNNRTLDKPINNFGNHKTLSLALSLNKIDNETASKIIDNYDTLINYFNNSNSIVSKNPPVSKENIVEEKIYRKRGRPSKIPARKIKDVNNEIVFGGKTITLTADNIIKLKELQEKHGGNSAEYNSYLTDISSPEFSKNANNWDNQN